MNNVDSLHLDVNVVETPTTNSAVENEILIVVAIFVIFTLILGFYIYLKRKKKKIIRLRVLNEGEVDFDNIVNSSFKAKALYDKLKKVCHPDKFAKNEVLNAKATEIFSLLVKYKYNYAELLKLKNKVVNELNVNIKED